MSEILKDIVMTRGDSYPLTMTVKGKSSGTPVPLTGYSFLLTVTSDKDPIDATTKVFQVAGVVDPDQVLNTGKVSFTPTSANLSTVGKFYYDIQMTVGSFIRTINEKNRFIVLQDNTKS
jgi:hypothetical protein